MDWAPLLLAPFASGWILLATVLTGRYSRGAPSLFHPFWGHVVDDVIGRVYSSLLAPLVYLYILLASVLTDSPLLVFTLVHSCIRHPVTHCPPFPPGDPTLSVPDQQSGR